MILSEVSQAMVTFCFKAEIFDKAAFGLDCALPDIGIEGNS